MAVAADPPKTISVISPATGIEIETVLAADPSDVEHLVAGARAAQSQWEALGFGRRGAILRDLRRWLAGNLDELLATLMAEGGRTREDALFGECYYVFESIGFWAKHASKYLAENRIRSTSPLALGRRITVSYRPRGVVGVIAPWNFPLALGFGDAIPALMAGNTVVLKPSSATPLSSLLIARAWREIDAPPGVLEVLIGSGVVGGALIDNVDMIMFTGSAATGREVGERAARRLIPVGLELGGKDPMIVLSDADLEVASETATRFGFWHSGQLCMSIERVYVEAPVYDAFVQRVVERTRALRQGASNERGSTEVGAMVTEDQARVVEEQIADAVRRGARILTGGRRRYGPGRFIEPTVLVDVDHDMRVMREETFGPVIPIMRVSDAEEAMSLANDCSYGLNSSIFTSDLARGAQLATRVVAGNTCVNDAVVNAGIPAAPFGASKESGLGVRNGVEGIRKYCQAHTILLTRRRLPGADILTWPCSARVTHAVETAVWLIWSRPPIPRFGGWMIRRLQQLFRAVHDSRT